MEAGEHTTMRAMSKAFMEIDFLGQLEEGASSSTSVQQTSSTQGTQNCLPQLHPHLMGAISARTSAAPAATSPMAVDSLAARFAAEPTSPVAAAPFTIFYNGTITTVHLPPDKAEAIIRWTERTTAGIQPVERPAAAAAGAFGGGSGRWQQPVPFLLDKLEPDLPLMRKRSLQRFLEMRKEKR